MNETNSDTSMLTPKSEYNLSKVVIHRNICPDIVGEMAYKLLEHFATVAAEPDGYDEAGRQKFKLADPVDAVVRAFDIAEAYKAECHLRGHFVDVPVPVERER